MPSNSLKIIDSFNISADSEAPIKRKRLAPFSLRLTQNERKLLDDRAGDMSLNAYIRWCVFKEDVPKPRTRGKQPVKDHIALGRLLGQLGQSRLANNLNQIAKAINTGTLIVSADVATELNEACREIADMRRNLITALGLKGDRS